jgi:hypothetical protein
MAKQALRAGEAVDPIAGLADRDIGQHPVLRQVGRSPRQNRDLGVAVEEHLLDVFGKRRSLKVCW